MNLVVGATGSLGSEICRLLAAQGKPLRAMVRPSADAAKVEQLKSLGAEIVQGDLHDPASLAAACRGVTAVISTVSACPNTYQPPDNTIQNVDIEGVTNLIAAAAAAKVSHFDLHLVLGEHQRRVPARAGQAHGGGAPQGQRADLHHPAPQLLYGVLAQPHDWV